MPDRQNDNEVRCATTSGDTAVAKLWKAPIVRFARRCRHGESCCKAAIVIRVGSYANSGKTEEPKWCSRSIWIYFRCKTMQIYIAVQLQLTVWFKFVEAVMIWENLCERREYQSISFAGVWRQNRVSDHLISQSGANLKVTGKEFPKEALLQ